ncbi:ribonuclease H-like domain-containing protein [Cerioporus squamosus]|nr:ribonuclease H-like domain-containing protein [Cerioporus squamosus]
MAFRVFCNSKQDQLDARPATRGERGVANGPDVEVFTDGSCKENGSADSVAAVGVWFGENDRRNISARLPGTIQSNQAAEVYAIEVAAKVVDPDRTLHIVSDSKFAIDGLTTHLPDWENRDWNNIRCAELFRRAAAWLRVRRAPTTFRWVKGHSGVLGNEGADALAKLGLEAPPAVLTELPGDVSCFVHSGIKLEVITQSVAYRSIRSRSVKGYRHTTDLLISRTQAALRDDYKVNPTEERVWMGIRDKDFSRKLTEFLWKLAHGAQRVGHYWENIQGYEQRAVCQVCGVEDSMDHILLECDASGQQTVWGMVQSAMALAGQAPLKLSLGAIIGAAQLVVRKPDGKVLKGLSRLAKLLVVEAAHLIWKLRCERVIQWEGAREYSKPEVQGRFWSATNRRMLMDRSLVFSRIPGRKPSRKAVLATWKVVLAGAGDLPADWLEEPGVLVGTLGLPCNAGIG